jgi:transposase
VGETITVWLDIAKHALKAHGADVAGEVTFRTRLGRLGHEVKLITPAYVKPFVKRQTNDMADAEAICEAAQRPTMRFVTVESEGAQAIAIVFRARDLLVRQRIQAINALCVHPTEFGFIVAEGPLHAAKLIAIVENLTSGLPDLARPVLAVLVAELRALDARIGERDREISRRAKQDETARRLMTIPGVGPVTATALAALALPAESFRRGRNFAAWLGLAPRWEA